MSFFSKKNKDKVHKDKEMGGKDKKSQFYVEFLGWMECRGVRGRRYTDPAIQELRRRQRKMDQPPKLTIQLTPGELRITQDFEEKRSSKRAGIKKVTFPAIPARDVTYVVQATRGGDGGGNGRPDDVVACIYLGYMPRTGRYVHVHVYRFDEPATAATFAKLMGALVARNQDRVNEVERELAEKGEIEDPGLAGPPQFSDGMSEHATTGTGTDSAAGSVSGGSGGGYSDNGSPTFGSDDMEADLQSLSDVQPFDNVAEELKFRLKMGDGPLLLPPKDYDTISRARGNLLDINQRRCMNLKVVGEGATDQQRPRNGSEESGIDLASPTSDGGGGDVIMRFPAAGGDPPQPQPPNNHPSPGQENEFVYPPRQDRGYPRSPAMSPAMSPALRRARHSPQGSPFGTRSSRTSHHSDGSGGGGGGGFPVYSRSNSSGSANNPHPNPPVNVVEPLQDEEGEYVPPTDYEDEPVTMRRQPFLPPPGGPPPRPHSGTPLGGSPMLMRSLPTSVLQSELALGSPRSPRSPRTRAVADGDEYFFNAQQQRRSQPLYASHHLLDSRTQSAELPGRAPRRVNSSYR